MKLKFLSFFFYFVLFTPKSYSCASCGSGGDDPLILYPNENWKIYSALLKTSGFRLVKIDGEYGEQIGPDTKYQAQVSFGKRWTGNLFTTIFIPFVRNQFQGESVQGFGDPVLSARYTLFQQDFTQEYLPQIQILGAFNRSMSRSITESRDDNLLDIFGSGYSQFKTGVDIWWGLTAVQFGTAYVRGYSFPKTDSEIILQPGLEHRLTATIGQSFSNFGKYSLGINRLWNDKVKLDGEEVSSSEKNNYSSFTTLDFFLDESSTVRLSASKQGGFLRNYLVYRNSTDSITLSLGYFKSW